MSKWETIIDQLILISFAGLTAVWLWTPFLILMFTIFSPWVVLAYFPWGGIPLFYFHRLNQIGNKPRKSRKRN